MIMDKKTTPILAKSTPSGDSSAEPHEKTYNAVTLKAHKEAQEIMNGKKKAKSYISAEEFLADLKA
jgi:hypothetical protein